jgi:hypothetical protein
MVSPAAGRRLETGSHAHEPGRDHLRSTCVVSPRAQATARFVGDPGPPAATGVQAGRVAAQPYRRLANAAVKSARAPGFWP